MTTTGDLIFRLVNRLDRLARLKAMQGPKILEDREMLLIWQAKEELKPILRELGFSFHGDDLEGDDDGST